MLAELRTINPAPSEFEITRQLLALEEAIAKLETEKSHTTTLERDFFSRPTPETFDAQSELNSADERSRYLAQRPELTGEAHDTEHCIASATNLSEKRMTATIGSVTPPRGQKWLGLTIFGLLLFSAGAAGIWGGSRTIVSRHTALNSEDSPAPLTRNNATSLKFGGRSNFPAVASLAPRIDTSQAQKVILYEEDGADAAGKRYDGTMSWHTETTPQGAGESTIAVRADIEIPDQRLGVRVAFTTNNSAGAMGSSVEIAFSLPPNYSHGGISRIAGISMKQSESSRGFPLAGVVAKVASDDFLINLSTTEDEMRHNVELLKQQSWLDVPIIYNDGFRAIIAIEKGEAGDRAFSDAFAAWEGASVPATQQ